MTGTTKFAPFFKLPTLRRVPHVAFALAALLGTGTLGCLEIEEFEGDEETEMDEGDELEDGERADIPEVAPERQQEPGEAIWAEPETAPSIPETPEEPDTSDDPEPGFEFTCGNQVVDPGEECDSQNGLWACAAGEGMAFCADDCTFDTTYCECPVGSHECPCYTDYSCDEGFMCDLSPDQDVPVCRPADPKTEVILACGVAGESCEENGCCEGGLKCVELPGGVPGAFCM